MRNGQRKRDIPYRALVLDTDLPIHGVEASTAAPRRVPRYGFSRPRQCIDRLFRPPFNRYGIDSTTGARIAVAPAFSGFSTRPMRFETGQISPMVSTL